MKYFFVFALLIGSISASELAPEQASADPRFIDNIIIGLIESASQTIRDAGLDPLQINREAGEISLPVPELFTAIGYAENVLVVGLSDIQVNNINFLVTRLVFDISLPRIEISIGRAYGKVSGFGASIEGLISGRVTINNIRVAGEAQISLLGGISLRSLTIDLTLGGVDSQITQAELANRNLTNLLNNFFGNIIPRYIQDFREDINYVLSVILLRVIDNILDGLTFARNLA